ncbi:MAG TPA: glycosyltransferase family 4 protein, partial [Lachnospiraceae bacterium]|nr:glycosyltransferase family 4 protein [Lachnospiraceae bacterium]
RIGSFYRIIKSEKPQLIHVSMSESLITFGVLRCLGFFKRIPFVYTDRGLCYGYRRHSKTCIMKTMRYAAGMICTTAYNKGLWTKEQMPCEITVIPNTISKAFDVYTDGKRMEERRAHGIADGEFVVGFAGRISEEKDWPFVEHLTAALRESGMRFKVALVLSVYEEQDAQIVKEIKDGIVKSIGRENLIYMQDLSQREIADYYYMVDVFVMSSVFESFGKAAVEAMS